MHFRLLASIPVMFTLALANSPAQITVQAKNKAIILRSEAELWSKGNLAVADELYATDFVCHFILGPEWRGIQGIKDEVRSHRTSFPDWHETVEDIVAEGDRVAIRITSTGTQTGEFGGASPSGRKVKIVELHIYRLANGKIAEQWGVPDIHGMMDQLSAPTSATK